MSTSSAHLPPARDNLEVSPPGVVAKEAKLKPVSQPPQDNVRSEFGPNEWLVDEMYERFLEDPDSVDGPWQELFKEGSPTGNGSPSESTDTPLDDSTAAGSRTPPAEPATPTDSPQPTATASPPPVNQAAV